jgi:dTDP-4-dehydrorhamnose 3,5-epimerase
VKASRTALPEVLLIEPVVHRDDRGFFMETYHAGRYRELGVSTPFVQDNLAYSERGVLRGLHLQNPSAQAKLVYVLRGEVYDVAVDVRVGSPNFGRWAAATLSEENKHQLFIPQGFAHGFCVMSEMALFAYKCSDLYNPKAELAIAWNDPDIGIEWPASQPTLSRKDAEARRLADIEPAALPRYPANPA